jgi:4-diphosphocytidyl-2-C-methyl-D-erythritol kinase
MTRSGLARSGSVTVRAPAKINLELRVGAPRSDGYHELATVFQAVSLTDDVTVTRTAGRLSDGVEVTVEGGGGIDVAAIPRDGSNLAVRAVRLLGERTGTDTGVSIHIHKRIPVAGGMAGGSADAAAALLACDLVWDTGTDRETLRQIAADLGSDVPFPLLGGTAIGTGRGEQLTAAMCRGSYTWVVATTSAGLSTPAVFAEIDRLRTGRVLPEPRVSEDLMSALRSGNAEAVGALLANDLQPAACALRPDLLRTLEVGEECEVLGALVSGSGPTVAFLVGDHDHALGVSAALEASGVGETVHVVTGPVHGARVVEGPWHTC